MFRKKNNLKYLYNLSEPVYSWKVHQEQPNILNITIYVITSFTGSAKSRFNQNFEKFADFNLLLKS